MPGGSESRLIVILRTVLAGIARLVFFYRAAAGTFLYLLEGSLSGLAYLLTYTADHTGPDVAGESLIFLVVLQLQKELTY